jgi:8-oxo-dGTP pyrophosphatase MutT (NUDIX family)
MPQEFESDAAHLSPTYVEECLRNLPDPTSGLSAERTAGVLFLIHKPSGRKQEPVLLLNKRSARVKQPGDLCCPGGRVLYTVDRLLSFILRAPVSPLVRSPGWRPHRDRDRRWTRIISLYWACCLRESWEEIGLRPWRVTFLGLLPIYRLQLFRRHILPLVGWLAGSVRFRLNWEVEKIAPIPFSRLLNSNNYGVYVLNAGAVQTSWDRQTKTFPCFFNRDEQGQEILWGATYHIAVSFLETVFDFQPPSIAQRPVVTGTLDPNYLTGDTPEKNRNDGIME